jgi:hypothetical protein
MPYNPDGQPRNTESTIQPTGPFERLLSRLLLPEYRRRL